MKKLVILIFLSFSLAGYSQFDNLGSTITEKELNAKFGEKIYKYTAEQYYNKSKDAFLFAGFSALVAGGSYYANAINLISKFENNNTLQYTGHGFMALSIGALIYGSINYSNYKEVTRLNKSAQVTITDNGIALIVKL